MSDSGDDGIKQPGGPPLPISPEDIRMLNLNKRLRDMQNEKTGQSPLPKKNILKELENLSTESEKQTLLDAIIILASRVQELTSTVSTLQSLIVKQAETKKPSTTSWANVVRGTSSLEELNYIRAVQTANKDDEDRKKRETNLTFSTPDIQPTQILEVCKTVLPDDAPEPEVTFMTSYTIGRDTDSPIDYKKYRIKFKTKEQRDLFYKESKRIRSEEALKRSFINPDWTPVQAQLQKQLRKEAKTLNNQLPEEEKDDWYVVYAEKIMKKSQIRSRSNQH